MAIAYVRDTGKIRGSNVSSLAGSFGTLPAVGNDVFTLSGTFGFSNGGAISAVTDNQGNSYTERVEATGGGEGCASTIYQTRVATSSGTFTFTLDPADTTVYIAAIGVEFSGLDNPSIDKTGTAVSTTGDATVTASAANAQNDTLVLAVACLEAPDAAANWTTPTTGYTALYVEQDGATYLSGQGSYKIVSAVETSSATWTHDNDAPTDWTAAIATFKAAGGAADPEGSLLAGKLLRGGLLHHGVLTRH
jgi:hypothetical protein